MRLHRRKEELLRVLEQPEIPLNTNASENDMRTFVIKRKISGGTMSRDGRDTMLGLMKTYQKLGLSFYHYLGDRLGVRRKIVPRWPVLSLEKSERRMILYYQAGTADNKQLK